VSKRRKNRKRTNKNVPAKGRLRDIADNLWSIAVRDDWANTCAVCGLDECEAHHIIPRHYTATRHDIRNGIALCASHHRFDPKISPHQNAAGWRNWLEDHHPTICRWYHNDPHPAFDGIKNTKHYTDTIMNLREYIEPDTFSRIVGIKFELYLETEYPTNAD